MFTSKIGSSEYVIDDSNYKEFAHDFIIDGSYVTRGRILPSEELQRKLEGLCKPFSFNLIPENEWQSRIEEMEKTKTRLSDIREDIPSLNQNGTNFCHTKDTEVLTENGWVAWPEYNWQDLLGTYNTNTGMLEFQPCLQKHVYQHHGEMIYSTNRSIDFGVTPDHRMLVREWNEQKRSLSNKYTFKRAKDLGWYFGLPHSTIGHYGTEFLKLKIEGDREYSGDDFIQLLSLIISDGYAGTSESTKNWVSFATLTSERRNVIEALAKRNGFHESPSKRGIWIRYDAPALANWLRANIYTKNGYGSLHKRIPQLVKVASSRQINLFLDMYGDQDHTHSKTEGRQYFSISKQCIDDIQELLLKIGKRGSIWSSNVENNKAKLDNGKTITSKHKMWFVHERYLDRLSIDRKKHLEKDSYNDLVYCATVPNGTLVTRRNGSILISGNCWANGPVTGLHLLQKRDGGEFVSLSPASVAAPIKGFRNVGGWGKEAIEWIQKYGVCPASAWSPNAIDRRLYNEANKKLALKFRVIDWIECTPRNLNEMMTCLLRRIPVAVGYNWWRHEVCAIDPVYLGRNQYGIRIWNSWGDSWSDRGMSVLTGNKMLPDDAVSPVTFTPN